ncbi:MAG: hypothetical protein FJ349_06920 [Sphingomonadales bacterium]|nr:hypothetical protein [Sphingomonadales bacterium]
MNLLLSKTNNLINSTMIKPHFLFFIATFLIALNSWSQDRVLQVENKETGKKVMIKPNQKIEIITSVDTLKGRFTFVSDSTLSIGNQTIVIYSISSMANRQVKKGMICVAFGSVGMCTGVLYYLTSSLTSAFGSALGSAFGEGPISANYIAPILMISASAATFVTGVVLVFRKQSYPKSAFNYQLVAG